MEKKPVSFDLIFDNGGGITIQTSDYAHTYDSPRQAAEDMRAIMDGADPERDGWEGNELYNEDIELMEYEPDVERNGGYRWYMNEVPTREDGNQSWGNIEDFVKAYYGN